MRFPLSFSSIAFDLDDTLLDTTGTLLKPALESSFKKMLEAGLDTNLQSCWDYREQHPQIYTENLFYAIAHQWTKDPVKASEYAKMGFMNFYSREIPDNLPLQTGARELLDYCKSKYSLYLVTSGDITTQVKKVSALKIQNDFKRIYYVDLINKKSKYDALRDILLSEKIKPETLLSIGNRLDQEIELAKRCGAQTCWVKHGEHSHYKPHNKEQIPDFTVAHISEIKEKCQL